MKKLGRAATCTATLLAALVACTGYTLTTSSSSGAPPSCPTGTGAAAVRGWSECGGGDISGDIRADLNRIGTSSSLIDACGRLARDVRRAQEFRPIPDMQAQTHWAAALTLYGRAADDCQRGDLDLARAALQSAGDEEGQAEVRLEDLRR